MTQLSAQSIRRLCETDKPMITPFVNDRAVRNGMSYGLSAASYDCRIAETVRLYPKQSIHTFTMEDLCLPENVVGYVYDKSTYARLFLNGYNTLIDPGFTGNLTLELTNHGEQMLDIKEGDPIIQLAFHWLDEPTQRPYSGKYQYQTKAAHGPRFEESR